jgi:hypothetical protein
MDQDIPEKSGAPGEIRTPDLLVRRQKCYSSQSPVNVGKTTPRTVEYFWRSLALKPLIGLDRGQWYSTRL